MRFDRYLLIACVTLSQACDSKKADRAPVSSGSEPKPEPEFVVTATQQGLFIDGKLLEPFVDGALPANVVDDAYRPIKLVPLLDKVTTDSVSFVVDKELSSWVVFQLMASAPSNVTRFKLDNVELRRGQEPSTATLSDGELFMTASQQVIALAPADTLSARLLEAVTRLPDRKRVDLVVDRGLRVARVVEVTGTLAKLVDRVGISPSPTDGPSTMLVSIRADGVVADFMQKNEKGVRKCFEESLARDGPTTGYDVTVTLNFDGARLADVRTVAHRMSHALSQCLSRSIREWDQRLPPGKYEFHILSSAK